MKTVKRVFSVLLILTMLLTFTSFPALADSYTYSPKTVYLEAGHNNKTGYSGPYLLARPTNNMYVGDKLALPDEGEEMFISVPQNGGANVKGFILAYGTTPYEISHGYGVEKEVYVAIDANGKMTGFYPTLADMNAGTNKTTIELNKAGKWLFAIEILITSTNGEYNMNSPQGAGSLHNMWNPIRWTLDVKETPIFDPNVNVPAVEDDVKATAKNILASLITDTTAFVDDIGQNQAYVMDVGRSEVGVDVSPSSITNYGNSEYETLKAPFGKALIAPVEGMRIDFDKIAYVKDIKLNTGVAYLKYDVMGSLDGENWFAISVDNTATSSEHTVTVDSAVKNLRVDYRDYNDHWGEITTSLAAINGVINVFPTETYAVTFKHVVSQDGEAQLGDATVTADEYGAYTVPSPFDSNVYEYFANASCTIKFDVTQKVANNTTVYVRLASSNPDPDVEGVIKVYAADNTKGYCGINFIERPINDIYVGNKLIVSPVAKYSTVPVLGGKSVAKVHFLYGVNGGKMKSAYIKIDTTSGAISGFYSDFGCSVPLEITLDTEGKWFFFLKDWFDTSDNSLCTSFTNFNYSNANQCREMFFFDVKAANTPKVSAPSVHPGVLANVRDILSTFDLTVTESETKNVIYYEGTSIAGSSENKIVLTPNQRKLISDGSTRMSYEAIRLDFVSSTYVKDLTINHKDGSPTNYFKYNVFGSTDGENWYLISKNNETTSQTFKVEVKSVVKYLRIDPVSGYEHWGITNKPATLTAINGYEGADNTWRVTYPEKIINVNALSDENDVITVPETFKSSNYIGATSINATAMIYGSDELTFVLPKEVVKNVSVPLGINIFNTKITLPVALIEELEALSCDVTLKVSQDETANTVSIAVFNGEDEIFPENFVRVMFTDFINDPTAIIHYNGYDVTDSGVINGMPVGYVNVPCDVTYLVNQFNVYEDAQASDESEYIRFLSARGIMNGITKYEFLPEEKLTRSAMYQALSNKGHGFSEFTHTFTDVAAAAPYAAAVQWAYDYSLISGTSFGPAEKVTKNEAALVIYKYAVTLKGVDASLYTDAVDFCNKTKIMTDASSSTYITRGEFAKAFAKFFNFFNTIDEVNYDDYTDVEFDEDNIVLKFSAMSDVHIDSLDYNAAAKNYENAMKLAYELSGNDLDMVFVAGDVVQNLMHADKAQEHLFEIDAFKKYSDLYIKDGTSLVFCTGNHDRYGETSFEQNFYDVFTATQKDIDRYYSNDVVEDCEYDKGNRHAVVNGYHFLSVGFTQNYISYLKPILDELVAEDPNKPIFVQYHFHAADTVYETHYGDATADASLRKFLDNYPQVIFFSGHTHDGLENPRSIWQGTFTAFETASVRYLDDNSLINFNVKIPVNATHTEAYNFTSEATLVEVDKHNNVRFTCYNTYRGDIIAQYVIAAPKDDNSHLLTYSDVRESYSPAPSFRENTKLTLSKTNAGDIDVFFDTATHDDIVWYYIMTFSCAGEEDQKFYFTSRYFDLNGMPNEISATLYKDANLPANDNHKGMGHNLTDGKRYTVTLTPYDAWDHAGEPLVVDYIH